jgi:hypothetical protein
MVEDDQDDRDADELLEGIDEIDWTAHHHAHGDASDVPGLLRLWLNHDRRTPSTAIPGLRMVGAPQDTSGHQAIAELWASVFHQGELHDAAVPLAPFLVRIVREGAIDDGLAAMDMLHHVLAQDRCAWEADGVEAGAHPLPAAYAAAADADTIVGALDDLLPAGAVATADVLAWIPAGAAKTIRSLRYLLQELEEDPRADPQETARLLLALATAGRQLGRATDAPRVRAHLRDPDPVGVAAALGLARLRVAVPHDPAYRRLLAALGEPCPLTEPACGGLHHRDHWRLVVADALLTISRQPGAGQPADPDQLQHLVRHLRAALDPADLDRLLRFHGLPREP